jgi:hypothetical protein
VTVDRSVTIRLRVSSAEFDAAMARAGTEVKLLGAEVQAAGRSAATAGPSFKPILDTITTIGPAAIPAVGGLIGLSSSVLGFGAAAALAFKGIKAEQDAGTQVGIKYTAGLATLKSGLAGLEKTAASGVLSGFEQSKVKIQKEMPELNDFVAQSSKELGSVGSHLVGAAAAGFNTFSPLIIKAEGEVNRLAGRFEAWASGSGGTKFMQTLSHDMDIALPALESMVLVGGRIVTAFAPAGEAVLELMQATSGLAMFLTSFPLPILQTMATAFVAFKIGSVIAIGAAAATKALTTEAVSAGEAATANIALAEAENLAAAGALRLAAAQRVAGTASVAGAAAAGRAAGAGEAGAAAGGLGVRGLAMGGAAAVARYAIPIAGIALIGNQLANATKDWQTSQNNVEMFAGNTLNTAKRIFTNPTHLFSSVEKNLDTRDQVKHDQEQINQVLKYELDQRRVLLAQGGTAYADYQKTLSDSAEFGPGGRHLTKSVGLEQSAHGALLGSLDQSGKLDQGAAGYTTLNAALEKAIKNEKTWTDAKGNETVKIDGTKYSIKAYDAALAQSNGSTDDAINILKAHSAAQADDQAAIDQNVTEQARLQDFLGTTEAKYKLTDAQVNLFASSIGLSASEIVSGNIPLSAMEQAVGAVATALTNGDTALQGWLASVNTFNDSEQTAADKAALLGAALQANMGVALSQAGANLSAASAAENASNVMLKYRTSISATGEILGQLTKTTHGYVVLQPQLTEGGLAIEQSLTQQASAAIALAQATYQNEVNVKGQKVATDDAIGTYTGLREQMKSTLTQTLGNADAAQRLTDKYLGVPKNVSTFAKLFGKGDVQGAVQSMTIALTKFSKIIARAVAKLDDSQPKTALPGLLNQIAAFSGTHTATLVVQNPNGGGVRPQGKDPRKPGYLPGYSGAAGRLVTEGTTGTADDVLMRVSKGEFVVNAAATSKHFALVNAINDDAIPGMAGGGYVPPSLITSPPASAGGSAAQAAPPGPTATQRAALAHLRITIDTTDISKFLRSLTGTAAQIQSAEATLANAVTKAGGGAALASALSHENHTLVGMADDRATIASRLKSANTKLAAAQKTYTDERTTVAKAITGAFDITNAGQNSLGGSSVQSILDDVKLQDAHASLFGQQLKQLSALGLNKTLVGQLAAGGYENSEATALALSGGSKSQIAALNAGVKKLGSTGTSIGTEVATAMYGAGVDAAKGLVAGLKSQEAALSKSMTHLADVMVGQIRHDLKMHSPSLVGVELGALYGGSIAAGIGGQHGAVSAQASRLARAAMPANYASARPAASSAGGGSATVQLTVEDRRLLSAVAAAMGDVRVRGELTADRDALHASVSSASAGRMRG